MLRKSQKNLNFIEEKQIIQPQNITHILQNIPTENFSNSHILQLFQSCQKQQLSQLRQLLQLNDSPMFSIQKVQTVSSSTLHSYRSIQDRIRFQPKTQKQINDQILKRICDLLTRKVRNRKCFTMQLLKQFLLFPDSSLASSNISVSKYDTLLFNDENLHSLQKIMETKLIEHKIWAFINLKTNQKQKQLETFVEKAQQLTTKIMFFHKEESFGLIRQKGKKQEGSKLSAQALFSISIHNGPLPDSGQKSIKFQVNLSKGTAESQREVLTSRRRQQTEYCRTCCCHGCCCCVSTNEYNLWQRIQYLNHLEQLMRIKERSCTLE